MPRNTATATGFGAILLWALLALFTVGSAPVPPLQLNALCFAIGAGIGLIWAIATGQTGALFRVTPAALALGTLGLFGYHFLYFSALRLAPAAEAGLIAYLWPLLIVLFSGLLPGERLYRGQLIGAVMGFAGAGLIVLPRLTGVDAAALPGLGLAALCALTWSGYSVLSRRLAAVPTVTVTLSCAMAALLSALAHLTLEDTAWPGDGIGWLAMLGLGLGPVGLAFFLWDIGVKRGDIQMLGVLSYAAPLLSTLALVGAGVTPLNPMLAGAAILITAGALIAARAGRAATRRPPPAEA